MRAVRDNQDRQDKYQHAISMLKSESLDLAIKKLELLSRAGDGHADAVLGALFEFGKGAVHSDQRKALFYYERSVATVASLQAWMGIGRISLQGPRELRDYPRALECFSLVADSSDYPQARLALGEIYLQGLGVHRDLKVAAHYFRRAVEQGNVFGYTGLAKVAAQDGKIIRSFTYRVLAVVNALRALMAEPKGGDKLQPW